MGVFDDWADDQIEEVDPGQLTKRLEALKENEPVPLPNEGNARRRRIERLESELNEIKDFLSDVERWDAGQKEIQTIKNDVRLLMFAHLAKLKGRATARGRTIHQELQFLRGLK